MWIFVFISIKKNPPAFHIIVAFFLMFVATEVVIIVKVLETGGDWKDAVGLMWTPESQGLFAAIMSFWFGNRAVSKYMKGR